MLCYSGFAGTRIPGENHVVRGLVGAMEAVATAQHIETHALEGAVEALLDFVEAHHASQVLHCRFKVEYGVFNQ